MAQTIRIRGECSVPGCDRPHCAKTYCKLHYYRLRRTGGLVVTQLKSTTGECSVVGCALPIRARALCTMHYDRRRRHGEVGPADSTRRRRNIGDTRISQDGYVLVYRPDYPGIKRPHYIQQHRLVLEAALGRQLWPFETAHHLNGVRSDNRIENLELWTHPQPTGQRPEDLAAWVVEFYPDLTRAQIDRHDEASSTE